MAAKRLRDGSDRDSDEPENSGPKKLRALPSFSTVIREAVMMKSMQNLFGALEPLFRRVMQEELEPVLQSTRLIQRSPQVQIEEVEFINMRLAFRKSPALPIFTGSKIEDSDSNPLRILLIDTDQNGNNSLATLPMPLKLEVVVLDGDFAAEGPWTSADFDKAIVKERTGRRPLLTGEFPVVLRDGIASIGELNFTDNSSWIRSQLFRIGVRVVQEASYNGPRVREAVTEAFRVKDHRGELYKKNYPPALTDEVWRLERIGKDGAFHKRLSADNINTVHDFLKLWAVNPTQLRKILGGMSDKIWEGIIGHARTCPAGDRLYVHHKQQFTVLLNTICEVMAVAINGAPVPPQELTRAQKAYVQEMVLEAYENWERLEETNGNGMLYNTVLLQRLEPGTMDQAIPQSAIAPSPLYPGPEIQFEDFHEDETTTTMIWGHHLQR